MNNRIIDRKNIVTRITLTVALVFALSGLVGAWSAPPEGRDRMTRKMNVLEKIFDEVLRESSNVFVSGSGATRGLLLDGYGALFTFDGSLTGGGLGNVYFGNHTLDLSSSGRAPRVWSVPTAPQKAPKGDKEERLFPDSVEEMAESWDLRREENAKKAREHLAGLKIELAETLLDYGATLGEISEDQWVVVAAFLSGSEGDGPEKLVLKAKMRDLRQYSAGQLTLDQAKGRVTITEQ